MTREAGTWQEGGGRGGSGGGCVTGAPGRSAGGSGCEPSRVRGTRGAHGRSHCRRNTAAQQQWQPCTACSVHTAAALTSSNCSSTKLNPTRNLYIDPNQTRPRPHLNHVLAVLHDAPKLGLPVLQAQLRVHGWQHSRAEVAVSEQRSPHSAPAPRLDPPPYTQPGNASTRAGSTARLACSLTSEPNHWSSKPAAISSNSCGHGTGAAGRGDGWRDGWRGAEERAGTARLASENTERPVWPRRNTRWQEKSQ